MFFDGAEGIVVMYRKEGDDSTFVVGTSGSPNSVGKAVSLLRQVIIDHQWKLRDIYTPLATYVAMSTWDFPLLKRVSALARPPLLMSP